MRTQSLGLTALSLLLCACQSSSPRPQYPDRSQFITELLTTSSPYNQDRIALSKLENSLRSGPWSARDRSTAFNKILRNYRDPTALFLTLEFCSDPALLLQLEFRKDFSDWLCKRLDRSDIADLAKRYDSALMVFITRYRKDPEQLLLNRLQKRQKPSKDDDRSWQLSLLLRMDLELISVLKEEQLKTLAPDLREILEDSLSQWTEESLRAYLFRTYGRFGALLSESQRKPWRARILRALDEESGFSKQECIQAAGKLGGAQLLERLEDQHDAWFQPALRLQVARALAYQSAQPKAQTMLQSRLEDWNEGVRKVAYETLLAEPQFPARRALALRALDENEDIALAAVAVISSETAPEEARAVMRRFERSPPKDEIQREKIFALLAKKGPVEFLSTGLTWNVGSLESYEAIYQRAVSEQKAFSVLRRCLAKGNGRARLFALLKLFRRPLNETGFDDTERVKIALYTLQSDPERETVLSAIIFLQGHGQAIEVRDALFTVIDDHRLPSARLEASRALSLFPGREKTEALQLASKDLSPVNRAFCYQELARSRHQLALVLLYRNVKAYPEDQRDLGDAIYLLMEGLATDKKAKERVDLYLAQLRIWGRSPNPKLAIFALRGLAAVSKVKTLPAFEAANIGKLRALLLPAK